MHDRQVGKSLVTLDVLDQELWRKEAKSNKGKDGGQGLIPLFFVSLKLLVGVANNCIKELFF